MSDTNKIETPELECAKHATSEKEIETLFNADEVCMNCKSIVYKDGVISCKYSRVN